MLIENEEYDKMMESFDMNQVPEIISEFRTKKCSKCGEVLPMNEEYFCRNAQSKDGFYSYCKKCKNNWTEWKEIKPKIIAKEGCKVCSLCNEEYPANELYFNIRQASKDGFNASCKKCQNNWSEWKFPIEVPDGYKKCSACQEIYPNNELYFGKSKNRPDGLTHICKKCRNHWKEWKFPKEAKEGYRICSKCNEEKPYTNDYFYMNKNGYVCRQCKLQQNLKKLNEIKKQNENITYNENMLKRCGSCKTEMPATPEYFFQYKGSKDGLTNRCKKCYNKYDITRKKEQLEYRKQYYLDNIERRKQKGKEYYKNNKESYLQKVKQYAEQNKTIIKEKSKQFRLKHKQKIKQIKKEYLQQYDKYDSKLIKKIIAYEEVRQDPENLELAQVKCAYCHKWTNPTVSQINARYSGIEGNGGENRIYCNNSQEGNGCRESCPIFLQKKYYKNFEINTSREVSTLVRQMCFERDDWTCVKCNSKDKTLHCHHIEGYTQNPLLGNDIDNVITVCIDCHAIIHQKDGCQYHQLQC